MTTFGHPQQFVGELTAPSGALRPAAHYRTAIRGRDLNIILASGGDDYRQMISRILPQVPENVLDNRSIELRDYLADPKEIRMKAAFAKIPEADVLAGSFTRSKKCP